MTDSERKATGILAVEDSILEAYSNPSPHYARFSFNRVSREDLDKLRGKSDDEFMRDVEYYIWALCYGNKICGFSLCDLEEQDLIACEIQRRSLLSGQPYK